ncbi:WxL domain-containing protein [uncultured Weissella sp.]|uniref:WxL domain-containing protein n=1 Tax=uncultured Weissella sp. TaxID=253243 RepID=UPI0027DB7322|nr:WxL domain-containing protein [uncultured Weissella sp.]
MLNTRVALSSALMLSLFAGGVALQSSAMIVHADDNLPAATSETPNDASGSVSGSSDAAVEGKSGYLTLDAVPDMNFGMTAQSSKATKNIPLVNNQGLIDDDGNDSGLLSVTDSRSQVSEDGKTTTTMPWQLTATLGSFSAVKGDTALSDSSTWGINLKQKTGTNSNGTMPGLYQPSLKSGDKAQHQVMQSAEGNGTGTTSVYYNKANTASLDMGQNVAPGQYDAPITWTLNATPDNSVN